MLRLGRALVLAAALWTGYGALAAPPGPSVLSPPPVPLPLAMAALPTTMPATVGAAWNNGGLLSVVQP